MKYQSAFTLTELMIVVAIVAIIAAVGIPSYQGSVRKGHRSDAQQLLLDASSKEEQYLLAARQYTEDFTALNVSKDGWSCDTDSCDNAFYNVSITADNTATPPTYLITATAIGTQAGDGDLTLDSTGARTHDGSTGW